MTKTDAAVQTLSGINPDVTLEVKTTVNLFHLQLIGSIIRFKLHIKFYY
jgi:hypothetical protein